MAGEQTSCGPFCLLAPPADASVLARLVHALLPIMGRYPDAPRVPNRFGHDAAHTHFSSADLPRSRTQTVVRAASLHVEPLGCGRRDAIRHIATGDFRQKSHGVRSSAASVLAHLVEEWPFAKPPRPHGPVGDNPDEVRSRCEAGSHSNTPPRRP
jgi:hypothetical protein